MKSAPVDVMPMPAEVTWTGGRMPLGGNLSVTVRGHDDARQRAGVARALRRWEERTGLSFSAAGTDATGASLVIECADSGQAVVSMSEDESYSLEITASQAALHAPTVVGILRGLETLLQLLQSDATGWFLSVMRIRDRPRFPWRGLLVDVCRHWQPMAVIQRILDGMSLVKLNVLHFHFSEDQGFCVESRVYPRLHELGSDGNYYTHGQVREIIAYAHARGIRVVPELDMPGHVTSWVVGYPEIASAPIPYEIARQYGVHDAALDPTRDDVYEFLERLLSEMAGLFPDEWFHIGGDENNGKQWNANPRIQAFIREHGLKDNAGLHAHFNRRVQQILARLGKKMVGWDEILHSNLPKETLIHVWRTAKPLPLAAQAGFRGILSSGFYVNHCEPAALGYANDPLPVDTPLTPVQQGRILGGEATMWTEWVTPETIDSRLWPRTAAMAERLWSPREVNDIDDMYRRLGVVSRRLEEAGMQHERNRPAMLRRFAGDHATADDLANLECFCEMLAPPNCNIRNRLQPGLTRSTPLTGLVDCLLAESMKAQAFSTGVAHYLAVSSARDSVAVEALVQQLRQWRKAMDGLLENRARLSPRMSEIWPVIQTCRNVTSIGEEALAAVRAGTVHPEAWGVAKLSELAAPLQFPVELAWKDAIRGLVREVSPGAPEAIR